MTLVERSNVVIKRNENRTSSLEAPIMSLTGHTGEIYSCAFSPNGEVLASCASDRSIFFWRVFSPNCENFLTIPNAHKGHILQLKWTADGLNTVSCATDRLLRAFDAESGSRVKQFKGHNSFVNSCDCCKSNSYLVCSASDDSTAMTWDMRVRGSTLTIKHNFSITSILYTLNGNEVITGGLDNVIYVCDLRKNGLPTLSLKSHTDTITGLALSHDGSYLLSNAMDNTLRIWDIRPYGPENRCVKLFQGHQHNFEKYLLRCCWSPDGKRVSSGSADRQVYIWDTATRQILYQLPGHGGVVTDVCFHPKQPIVASCSLDRKIFLGELSD